MERFDSIDIDGGKLEGLYWGEGTPDTWHTAAEIADIFGCTKEAIERQLAVHAIRKRTRIDRLVKGVWDQVTSEWGLAAEFAGRIDTCETDVKISGNDRGAVPLAFKFNASALGPEVRWLAEWELVILPGRAESDFVVECVDKALARNGYKKVEKVQDNSHEIDW